MTAEQAVREEENTSRAGLAIRSLPDRSASMSDVPATPTPETGTAATPETGNTTSTGTSTEPETGSTPTAETATGDTSAMQAALKKANAEAAKTRKEVESLQAELKKRTDAELSETERLKLQATEATDKATAAEQRANDRVLRSEIRLAAAAAGFADADDAIALVDRSGLDWDADGSPTGVTDAVAALAALKPHLVKVDAPKPTGGAPSMPAGTKGQPVDLTRNTKLTAEQIAALPADVRRDAIRRATSG